MGKIGAFVMATLISGVAVMVAECIQKNNNKDKVMNTAMAVVVADAIMGILYLVLKDKYTKYEFIFINIAVAFVCEFFAFPVSKKRKIEKSDVLKLICMESVIVAVYSILTYGQTIIHSDTATATLLSESILKHHSFFPRTWNYVNGDIWVLNNGLFCILPTMVFSDQSFARALGSFVFVLIVIAGVAYQSKKMFKNECWLLSVPILLVCMYGSGDMILYQAAYTGGILWIAICPMLLYKSVGDGKKLNLRYYIPYGIITILLLMGGIRMMAEQTVPLLGAIVITYIINNNDVNKVKWKEHIKPLGYALLGVIVPSVMGYGIYKWLVTWHNVNNTVNNQMVFVDSINTVGENIVGLIRGFYDCFGYSGSVNLVSILGIRNMISIILATLVCFVIPILQYVKFQKETKEIQFFLVFGLIHNAIMIILAVFTGKGASRYLLTSIFFLVIISAHYVYHYWFASEKNVSSVLVGCFAIAMVVEGTALAQTSAGWVNSLRAKKEFNQTLLSKGLEKGYASYWNAYTNEVYSDLNIHYGGINITESGITPFRWLVDDEVYTDENINTFLLLDESENQYITLILDTIGDTLTDSFMLDGMYVYVFDHDLARDMQN